MKIDLITLHNVKNYGSALQTYATQELLKKFVDEVEIINYSRKDLIDENIVENRIKTSKIFSKNFITRFIGKIFIGMSAKKQIEVFNEFLNNNINMTKRYNSYEELEKDVPEADIYCTGSDQVWNSEWNKGIERAFFLDFVKDKTKISYAASFGKEKLNDEEIEITRNMLQKYKMISVRENSAVDIIHNLGIDNVQQVLDPTLMLNKEQWSELKLDIKYMKKYILVYQLNTNNPKFDKYVKELSRKKKLPVIRLSNVIYQIFKYGKLAYCPKVNEFLTYFLNAEYIVTDSFHATGFSINFNKKFICIFPKKFSTRLQSILELTGLENRKVTDFSNLETIDNEIDWDRVNRIIDRERKKSMDFLAEAIKQN